MKRRALGLLLAPLAAVATITRAARAADDGAGTQHIDDAKTHRLAIQVDVSETAVMNMVLNNINAIYSYYQERSEPVTVELVTFGPGIAMLRDDISPVKERVAAAHQAHPTLVFSMCENTRRSMSKAEGHDIKAVSEAGMVPSGVVRLSELQENGYSYIRP